MATIGKAGVWSVFQKLKAKKGSRWVLVLIGWALYSIEVILFHTISFSVLRLYGYPGEREPEGVPNVNGLSATTLQGSQVFSKISQAVYSKGLVGRVISKCLLVDGWIRIWISAFQCLVPTEEKSNLQLSALLGPIAHRCYFIRETVNFTTAILNYLYGKKKKKKPIQEFATVSHPSLMLL